MTRKPSSATVRHTRQVARQRRRSTAPFLDDVIAAMPPPGTEREKSAYFNRELSWLAFNRRVLEQAQSDRHPLLERVRFLAIFSSNLDEFFEIRVAGLIQQVASGVTEPGLDGLGALEQLRRIHLVVASLVEDQYRCWHRQLMPALASEGIVFRGPRDLNPLELAWVRNYFRDQVFPVLTPLAIDQSHPFPHIGNKTLNIVACLDDPQTPEADHLVAILPVPRVLPRLVRIEAAGSGGHCYIFLTDIIKLCAGTIFPGYVLEGAHAFRVTRNSDLYIDEEEAANLLKKIEEELRNLHRGAAVRLEIEEGVADPIFAQLCDHLALSREYVFRLKGPINLLRLASLTDIDRPDLKYPPFHPVVSPALASPSGLLEIVGERDVLLHHPYDTFSPVVEFVEQAARDPKVFAIKQTLYRTSGDSPIVRALIEASRNGKQVTALIELKARFDEANNIQWARQLEDAGVHVVYGVVGKKTHCKLCLVVRQEGKKLRHYAHLGTGNYNPRTARLYTDLSLFTANAKVTTEIARLFNALTGFGRDPQFDELLVAPYNLHERLQSLIRRESEAAAAGRPARIIAKMNSLVDRATIDNLYAASRAGVSIDLIVRGVCCLVPGLPGQSENIRVRSLVGRFLEHARVYYFENDGGEPAVYAGSADWMPRNFFRRVEVVFPIHDPAHREWIVSSLLPAELGDAVNSRVLHASGAYLPPPAPAGAPQGDAHKFFIEDAAKRAGINI
jgi:polyphosphate kinase